MIFSGSTLYEFLSDFLESTVTWLFDMLLASNSFPVMLVNLLSLKDLNLSLRDLAMKDRLVLIDGLRLPVSLAFDSLFSVYS